MLFRNRTLPVVEPLKPMRTHEPKQTATTTDQNSIREASRNNVRNCVFAEMTAGIDLSDIDDGAAMTPAAAVFTYNRYEKQ